MISNFGLSESSSSSRIELLLWFNSQDAQPIQKIEQLGTGVVYCQLFSKIFPEFLPNRRIKENARSEIDYIYNFKLLMHAFDKCGIVKIIEVDKLVKLKFQDNLEFAQWVKRFYHVNFGGHVEILTKQTHRNHNLIKNIKEDKLTQKLIKNNQIEQDVCEISQNAFNCRYVLTEVLRLQSILKKIKLQNQNKDQISQMMEQITVKLIEETQIEDKEIMNKPL